ncbi:hypothetical protein S2M10_36200 [Sphingomonas sp. S2M10]|uniref:VOC family protein n=1 Tax=Sphingomonas sp. S2M10 TaxID=2705010 RepID=UPI001457619A|nr:VOC family protein [Sphingomonas sp. S2M10]NLS28609.1 hypothetical protein [Sphingomonas sp. S2M10]
MARLNYLELPAGDVGELKGFYGAVFDWHFADFGPSYAATMSGDTDVGLDGDAQGRTQLLPVIAVDDLEATLAAVEAAGGVVTVPIFSFPGGRRFHFRDPQGHELAAWVTEG